MGLYEIACGIFYGISIELHEISPSFMEFQKIFHVESGVASMENFTRFPHGIRWGIKLLPLFCGIASDCNCVNAVTIIVKLN